MDFFKKNCILNKNLIDLKEDPLKRYFKSYMYQDFFLKFKCIGITGSCGKTSTALYIYHFMKIKKIDVCYIGTHKILYNDLCLSTDNTTLEIDKLYGLFKKYGIHPKYIVMEVSSHGINQARINCFHFDFIGLTNLGQDHLDYHLNLLNYHNVKKAFLYHSEFTKRVFVPKNYYENKFHHVTYYQTKSKLFKDFNNLKYDYDNLYLAYLILKQFHFKKRDILNNLKNIHLNNGRGEIIYDNQRRIIIDYAHQVESFKAILNDGNYEKVVVFGCGGNREKQKRALMGKIACKYCRHVIICEDNSRNEDLLDIIHDICSEIQNYKIILNRKEAIDFAMNTYSNLDIYILGKGDENFILKNNQKIKFNDKEEVLKIIQQKTFL